MFLGFIFAAQVAAAGLICPAPVIAPESVREWSQNIAIVRSEDRTGLGLVVGWQPGQAWISVPAHVVFGEGKRPGESKKPSDPDSYLAHLTIRLSGDKEPRAFCASSPGAVNLKPPQGTADLTFVCVQWEGRPFLNSGLVARLVKVGDEVQLAGPNVVEDIRGKISRTLTTSEVTNEPGDIQAEELKGIEGLSGALTVNPAGVVGVYLGKDSAGWVLSLAEIRANARRAKVPWQLTDSEFYDCNRTRRVCIVSEGDLAPAKIAMNNVFIPAPQSIATGSCADIPEGKYQIVVPAGDPVCEPKYLSVLSADNALKVSLRCAPGLGGTWRAADGDTLLCVETSVGSAQCSGLSRIGFGFFEGTLSAKGKHLTLAGAFRTAGGTQRTASGDLAWETGRLSGQIQREQAPPRHIELKRVEDQ